MPSRSDLRQYYDIGAQLAPAIHQHQDWPYEVPHPRYVAYLSPPHDVGGQPDAPVRYEEKEEEAVGAEHLCHLRGARVEGRVERRGKAPPRQQRPGSHRSITASLTTDGWIWAAARMLVDKNHVSLTELLEKIAEVRARYEQR